MTRLIAGLAHISATVTVWPRIHIHLLMLRLTLLSLLPFLAILQAGAQPVPSSVEITLDPQKFGDVASILKVDASVAGFKFDQPVSHLALVLEAYPKEANAVHVARLALELTKPMKEGRLCVQMADQGFLPLGNGAPHQMQLFMQVECAGTIISSSQSFLKEKFNFSRSLARTGAGTITRRFAGHRVPVFWLMGNSDNGTYFNDDDLDKMIAKNRNAYVLIAYLEIAKQAPAPELAQKTSDSAKSLPPLGSTPPAGTIPPPPAFALVGPPFPVPTANGAAKIADATSTSSAKSGSKAASSKSSKTSSSKKKKRS